MDRWTRLETEAQLVLPLQWTVAVKGPMPGWKTSPRELRWPTMGTAYVHATVRTFSSSSELPALGADLVFAQCASRAELEELVAFTGQNRQGAVFFDSDATGSFALPVPFVPAGVVVLPHPNAPGARCEAPGAVVAQLVRERFISTVLAHWQAALLRYAALAGIALHQGWAGASNLARPAFGPLATLEHNYVAGVVGLWLDGMHKPAAQLGISQGRLRRLLGSSPSLQAAVERLPPRRDVRMLVVEDDARVARATERCLQSAARRSGHGLAIEIAGNASEAIARIERGGAPELLWVDVGLPGDMDGLGLVRWLREERLASVVFGKSGGITPEILQQFATFGALGVWSADSLPVQDATLSSAVHIAGQASVIRAGESVADMLQTRLATGLDSVEAGARVHEICVRMAALVAEAAAPIVEVEGVLELDTLRAYAAREALGVGDGLRRMAALLGVQVKTLRRLGRLG